MDSETEEEITSGEDDIGGSSPAIVSRRNALGSKNPKYLHALRFSYFDWFFRGPFYISRRQYPPLLRAIWTFRLILLLRHFEFRPLPPISRRQYYVTRSVQYDLKRAGPVWIIGLNFKLEQ